MAGSGGIGCRCILHCKAGAERGCIALLMGGGTASVADDSILREHVSFFFNQERIPMHWNDFDYPGSVYDVHRPLNVPGGLADRCPQSQATFAHRRSLADEFLATQILLRGRTL
jgi:hypothetical protein